MSQDTQNLTPRLHESPITRLRKSQERAEKNGDFVGAEIAKGHADRLMALLSSLEEEIRSDIQSAILDLQNLASQATLDSNEELVTIYNDEIVRLQEKYLS